MFFCSSIDGLDFKSFILFMTSIQYPSIKYTLLKVLLSEWTFFCLTFYIINNSVRDRCIFNTASWSRRMGHASPKGGSPDVGDRFLCYSRQQQSERGQESRIWLLLRWLDGPLSNYSLGHSYTSLAPLADLGGNLTSCYCVVSLPQLTQYISLLGIFLRTSYVWEETGGCHNVP